MQRMQLTNTEKPFSFDSSDKPFTNYLIKLDLTLNGYANQNIQTLNQFIGILEGYQEQKVISEKLYQLFITKYQKLTELIVGDKQDATTVDSFKKQFHLEWDKILKAEGQRNLLLIVRARPESTQETELKNQFLHLLDKVVALRDSEGLGQQAVTITQELQSLATTIRNTAAVYATFSYNTTNIQEANQFAHLSLQDAKQNLAEDIGDFRKHALEIETQATDYILTYQQMFPETLQTALDRLADYPQAIKNVLQQLKERKLALTKGVIVENLPLDNLVSICEQVDTFQYDVKHAETQFSNRINQDLKSLPHHSTQLENSLKRKQVTVDERLNRLVNELKRLASHSTNRGPLSEIITNIKVITERTNTDLKLYLADLQKEKKAIFTKRDEQYISMQSAMSEHFYALEDTLYKLLILLVKLELPSLETAENQGPQQQYYLDLKTTLNGLKSEVESVEPLWLKLKTDRNEEQSAKTAEALNLVQSSIEKLNSELSNLLNLPTQLVNEEYDKILKLQKRIQAFEEKVGHMVKAIKYYQGKKTQFFLGNNFKDLHDCHLLLTPVQNQKHVLTKKIQTILQDKKLFEERAQRLIENDLNYLQNSYAILLQKDDHEKLLQNIKQRYLNLKQTSEDAVKNLTVKSLSELQQTVILLQRTTKSLPLLSKDLTKLKSKLAKEHVTLQQEAERLKLLNETKLWQTARTMNTTAAQALSPEDKVTFLRVETEHYQHHILKQGSTAKDKKDIVRRSLAILNEDQLAIEKLKQFESIFISNETALRRPREGRFKKALKSILSFLLPFKSVKEKLQRVHGALYADQVKKLFDTPEAELQINANKETDGLNTAQLMQAFGPKKSASPTKLSDNEVEMQNLSSTDDGVIIEFQENPEEEEIKVIPLPAASDTTTPARSFKM